jgi:Nuclear pore component
MCLDVAFFDDVEDPVVGAVISGDVQLGHVLVSRLASGQMVAINLTETRHLREMESLTNDPPPQLLAMEDGSVADIGRQLTQSLQDTEPLSDIVQPLIQKVYQGISRMAQLGGSSTPPGEITPNILAGAVAIQNQCDREVLLPLLEMNEYVSSRRAELAEMYRNQLQQLKSLQAMVSKLQERSRSIEEKSKIVKSNAHVLAKRGASVLQSTTDLLPSITEAEYSHFQLLKRLDSKSREWQNEVERLQIKVLTLRDLYESGATAGPLHIPEMELANLRAVLRASGTLIHNHSRKLDSAEGRIADVARAVGFVSELEEPI